MDLEGYIRDGWVADILFPTRYEQVLRAKGKSRKGCYKESKVKEKIVSSLEKLKKNSKFSVLTVTGLREWKKEEYRSANTKFNRLSFIGIGRCMVCQ